MAEVQFTTENLHEVKVTEYLNVVGLYVDDHTHLVSSKLSLKGAKQLGEALILASEGRLQEQKYYIKMFDNDYGYVNVLRENGNIEVSNNIETSYWQSQFTQEEIDSNPELKKFEQFKIPVPLKVVS